ncbi:MAG: NADH-ubiquinone oxidoreductase-F iron-sulfur binding region domain-containing protein [Acidihalobacter sp.]
MEPVLSRHFHLPEPPDLKTYGDYHALRAALEQKPADLIDQIGQTALRGYGGAGFPLARKWLAVAADAPRPHYMVINLDETEPGSFKDRQLLYRDPHQIVEAIMVGGYIQGSDRAFVFVRGEYAEGAEGLQRAVDEAREAGLVGKNVLGSGFSMDIDVHLSAGRYICGEETALLNALEGRRANPRSKPPFPFQKGLWGKPTLVNNLETVCQVPGVVLNGVDWFKAQGINGGEGTKLYSVCGPVKNPGFWELPMGTTARELIYEHAGGMLDGRELTAFLPGGASTAFLLPEHVDAPMHFESVAKLRSRFGTCGIIVLDDATCPVDFLIAINMFFVRESCGFCTPCRDGLPYAHSILERIEAGKGKPGDREHLLELCGKIAPNSFCAFAPGAVMPMESGLNVFADVIEEHIEQGGCPWQHEPARRAV